MNPALFLKIKFYIDSSLRVDEIGYYSEYVGDKYGIDEVALKNHHSIEKFTFNHYSQNNVNKPHLKDESSQNYGNHQKMNLLSSRPKVIHVLLTQYYIYIFYQLNHN